MRNAPAFLALTLVLACDGASTPNGDDPAMLDAQLRDLLDPYVAPIGTVNTQPPAMVDLGRSLFFDKILSGNRDMSCGTCHDMNASAVDGLSLAVGTGGTGTGAARAPGAGRQFVARNAPSIINTGLGFHYTLWDGRVNGFSNTFIAPKGVVLPAGLTNLLAAQATLPVLSRVEMRGNPGDVDVLGAANELATSPDSVAGVWNLIMQRLVNIQGYVTKFSAAYPTVAPASLTYAHVANAIAAFELATFNKHDSPFDRYLARDNSALTDDEKRGGILFFGKAGCSSCHFGALMGGESFINIGVPQIGPGFGKAAPLDKGRAEEVGFAGYEFAFRVAPLRNVELTAPYMHNGAYPTLEAVLKHYTNPDSAMRNYDVTQLRADLRSSHHGDAATIAAQLQTLDGRLTKGIPLTAEDRRLLVIFLKSLTDPSARNMASVIPASVPSGLPVP
jgi:cytochrome c peroxidase